MSFFNKELVHIAKDQVSKAAALDKEGFVPPPDPSGGAGGAGAPPGAPPAAPAGDPSGGGDPAAAGGGMPGMDPSQSAPPADPAGGMSEARVMQMIQQAMQAGGAGGAKKKVDVNTELYHIKRLLVQLIGMMGGSVDPKMLLGDPAEDPYAKPEEAANDPASAAAQPGALESAIKPPEAMPAASPQLAQGGGDGKSASLRSPGEGVAKSQLPQIRDKAAALRIMISKNANPRD